MSTHLEKSLFIDALEFTDPAARKAFLDQACAGNPALRARLDRLLDAQEPSDTFFTLPAPPADSATASPSESASNGLPARFDLNSRIGRYQLTQRLGEGGCGVVYLAEQQEPVRRPVALKIIRLGMDTAAVITRFETERQALALMDHPNIARVLDAGTTESGLPYFVMEVVQGVKITDYCDQHRLDVSARLDLFVRVCHAIQHAHQKGVIHLDIKPSNILITLHDGQPVPKLIDFGIARAAGPHLHDSPSSPAGAAFIGTPAYMSPEQAESDGADVDTRGDIFSLGVLLGELLAGRAPFDTPPPPVGSGIEDFRRFIRERRALAPSALLSSLASTDRDRLAAQRHTSAPRLAKTLRDDLDCIVLKALQPDRRQRYETSNALAMDVRRCLDHEPVVAHAPGRLYRLRKLIRRNRGVFIAGTLVTLALVAGLGTSTWLFLRERDARAEAEHARTNEVALRRQAEAREEISQAAVHLSHGDLQKADALLADIPLELIPPSLECAQVMRTLGYWHAFAGRWEPAAARFAALTPAIILADLSDTDAVSRYLLPAAAAIREQGDPTAYERFRQMIIARFARTTHPTVAEQIIKTSLLMPADAETLKQLEPLARVAVESIKDPSSPTSRDPYMSAWSSIALSLLAYRQGNYDQAIDWSRRCLASPNQNPPRAASAHALIAMASHQLGKPDEEVRAALDQSRKIVAVGFSRELDQGNATQGLWADWINARGLLREASAVVEK